MKYLHTMVRVTDIEDSLRFYCEGLGLEEVRRTDNEAGRYTLIFLSAPGDVGGEVELTFNWDPEEYTGGRNFGHLAYRVEQHLRDLPAPHGHGRDDQPSAARRTHGVRPLARQHLDRADPGGAALAPAEPWSSMQNTGKW